MRAPSGRIAGKARMAVIAIGGQLDKLPAPASSDKGIKPRPWLRYSEIAIIFGVKPKRWDARAAAIIGKHRAQHVRAAGLRGSGRISASAACEVYSGHKTFDWACCHGDGCGATKGLPNNKAASWVHIGQAPRMGDDLGGKLCSSIITWRVTLNVARPRILKVGATGDPVSNAGWYKNRKAKRDKILAIRRETCSAHARAVLGLRRAAVPENQIGGAWPAGVPEYRDNHFLTDLTRAGMTDGHRKVELFLDNLRTYVLANGQEQQRRKDANKHQVPQRRVYHEALSIPHVDRCGQAIFGIANAG
jgi:hypothetical protein